MFVTKDEYDARIEFDLLGGYLLVLGRPGDQGSDDYCYGVASREEALDLGRSEEHLDGLKSCWTAYDETTI